VGRAESEAPEEGDAENAGAKHDGQRQPEAKRATQRDEKSDFDQRPSDQKGENGHRDDPCGQNVRVVP
jgi:hypothetical protein